MGQWLKLSFVAALFFAFNFYKVAFKMEIGRVCSFFTTHETALEQ